MSKKSKRRQGGNANSDGKPYTTVRIDGVPHNLFSVETKTTFTTTQFLTREQLTAIQRAANTAQANAISEWIQAHLGAKVTGDIHEYLQELAPITGRLNS